MRKLSAFLVVVIATFAFAATPTPQLVSPCSVPTVAPHETFTTVDQLIVLSGALPIGMCGFKFSTPTSSVIAIESFTVADNRTRVEVRTLAPGEGIVNVAGVLPGGSSYTREAAVIHVDSCNASLKLLPSYAVALQSTLTVQPEVSGTFQSAFVWYVDGVFHSIGPRFVFTPPRVGTFVVTVRAGTPCWTVEAKTSVVAISQRMRGVRRR
jgi:hypothetical protein